MTDWEKIFATFKTNIRYLILKRPLTNNEKSNQ